MGLMTRLLVDLDRGVMQNHPLFLDLGIASQEIDPTRP